jgi:hypothetical protein
VEEYGFEAAAAAGAGVERLGEEAAARLGEMEPRGRRGGEDAMVGLVFAGFSELRQIFFRRA